MQSITPILPRWARITSGTLLAAALGLLALPGPAAQGRTLAPGSVLTDWIINSTGATNPHFTGPVYVSSVNQTTISGVPYAQVHTNGLPDYQTTMTAADITALNSRPRAATDFTLGHTTATAGQVVRFGDNIGYRTTGCALGYWPPGPGCPTAQNKTVNIPMQPIFAITPATMGLGAIGLWLDGSGIYNWSDGQSYGNAHIWWNTAMTFEQYDMDICTGHAAQGDYHHHSYSPCLAALFGDPGTGPSPIYGYAADGYPVYGPWESAGVLAQSGWKTRDYNTAGSPTGCATAYVRNCLLVNPLDPSQGTTAAPQTGPRTDTTVTTMSGNTIASASGIYQQDYWFDTACGGCLDPHNGIDLHDGRGYHYHLTVTQDQATGKLIPAYPYTFGPTYAGMLAPNATYTATPAGTPATATPTATAAPPTATRTATTTATRTATATATQPPPPSATVTNTPPPGATATPSATATATQPPPPSATANTTPPPGATDTSTATTCAISFSDVTPADYFYTPVRYLACRGVVGGYSDGTFRPYTLTTRGQLAKIVVLAYSLPLSTPPVPTFADVLPGSTFYPYIETAAAQGIVGGYPDGTFRPGNNVTRGQLTKIVVGAAGWALLNPPAPTFSDVLPGSTFYPYVETAVAHGILGGYADGTFRPGNSATRGQISKIVYLAVTAP
jgi:hypothetical protein